jgi:hypothetical protein
MARVFDRVFYIIVTIAPPISQLAIVRLKDMYEIKKGCAQAVAGVFAVAATYAIAAPAPATAASFTLNGSNNNSFTFNYTGAIDTVNITTTGVYTIDAFGARAIIFRGAMINQPQFGTNSNPDYNEIL